jgi:branched-chain amino acid transport system substrate-binding protein
MILAAVAAATLALTACGGGGGGGAGGQATGETVKLGVLTTLSGQTAAGFVGVQRGAEARIQAYKAAGGRCANKNFQIVMGDDTSTPQGALTAAQRLVQQENVYAVLPVSPFLPGAAQYLATQAKGAPVVGSAIDGAPQWLDPSVLNFFSATGASDFANIPSTYGQYWKELGGTKVAVVGNDTPSSAKAAEGARQSALAAGLQDGYSNVKLPIGSTDVGAIVLGIKDSGADVLYMPVTPQTAFAIVGGLRQAGVHLKSVLLATGYGADLLASPPALQAAAGVGFITVTAPTELNTEATRAQSAALKQYAGSPTGVPSFSENSGWLVADLFLYGLEAAGCDATQADYITALNRSTTWDAGGLFPHPRTFTEKGVIAAAHGPGNCIYISTVEGDHFVPDPKASPICGTVIGKV